jgi:DnaJ-class molecular chaperone
MRKLTNNQKEVAEETCSFCGGTGKDPYGVMSWLSTCCVCGGKGVVLVRTPYTRCAHCNGTGSVKTLTCTVCMGKGFVPVPPGRTLVCDECGGSGDDRSAPAMACLKCHGRGFIAVAEEQPAAGQLVFSSQG